MTFATRRLLGTAALLLATGALTVACGPVQPNSATAGSSSSPGGGTAPNTAPAAPASSPAASPGGAVASGCSSSALKAQVDIAQGGAAAGSTYVPIDFTNTSGSACTLDGYPGVSFVRSPAGGGQLGNPATRNPAAAPTVVTLAPGGIAHAMLQVAEAGNYSRSACTPVTAHWLKIFPPNQAAAIYARYDVQACSSRLPAKLGSQLAVYVVRPGAGKAGHAP